jgi:hypothetical protein
VESITVKSLSKTIDIASVLTTQLRIWSVQIAIIGCHSPATPGSRTCSEATHQKVEQIHHERGQARFQLKERLERARVAHPNDAVAEDRELTELADVDDETEEFEVDSTVTNSESQPTKKERIRAQFGQRRTHNEQIVVTPCGMIIARETFYGAEGVGSVIVRKLYLNHSHHCSPSNRK